MPTVVVTASPQKSSPLRRLAERMSRGLCLRRSIRTRQGKRRMFITPEASLRYWLPGSLNSDVQLFRFAERYLHRGSKVWDIGANIGVFTVLAACQIGNEGRLLSVEADPFLSQLLLRTKQSLELSDASPDVVTVAVADCLSLADFIVPERSRASNHLSSTSGCLQAGGDRFSFKVPCVTLDWLLEQSFAPEFVKMDIEGVEAQALAAAPRLLTECRPVLHLEVWNEIADELRKLLQAHDYLFFDGDEDLEMTHPVERPTWCTIAVPREKHPLKA